MTANDAASPSAPRRRSLRRQLSGSLVAVALASVVLIGGLNLVAARRLLDTGTTDRLVEVGESRARSIESGAAQLARRVAAIASDLAVADALVDLRDAFDELGAAVPELDDDRDARFESFYTDAVIEAIAAAGLPRPDRAAIEPSLPAARYLQAWYTTPWATAAERRLVVDAGDGSDYSAVHSLHHSYLVALMTSVGGSDLLLVDGDGTIVYSVDKRIDLGTSLVDGPYRDTLRADAVVEDLRRERVGEPVVSDFEISIPAGGRPTASVAVVVRRDTEVVGALVVEIDTSGLDALTTAGGRWDDLGLGGGESYVVGSDLVLRSASRGFDDDPDAYLDAVVDADERRLIEVLGSPVGLHTIDTEASRAVRDGEEFRGTTRNASGQPTFTFARPIDVPGVDWAVIVDTPRGEVTDPLFTYGRRLLLVVVLMLPLAALVGLWLSRRLTRPIPPVVAAARAVMAGDRDPDLDETRNDEFGDLARRLRHVAHELGAQEAALSAEYEHRRRVLMSVVPPRLIGADGEIDTASDRIERATAVAVAVDGASGSIDRLGAIVARIGEAAERHGLELVRGGADRLLYVAGIGRDDIGAGEALAFAEDLVHDVGVESAEDGIEIHAGVASGDVATGLLQRGSLTFAAWGEPVRRALAISALRSAGQVIVDQSTVDATPDAAIFGRLGDDAPRSETTADLILSVFTGRPAAVDGNAVSPSAS